MAKENEIEEIKIMIDNKIVQKYVKEEYDKGFLAGQNSQKEKVLEMIKGEIEFFEKFRYKNKKYPKARIILKYLKEELQQKIKSQGDEE